MDRTGDGARPDIPHQWSMGGRRPDAVRLERGQQLAQQQRVPARGDVALVAERRIRVGAEPRPHEVADGPGRQRPGMHEDRLRVVGDVRQHGRIGARVAGAPGRGHEQPLAVQAVGEVGDEPQRLPVGPLEIVDCEQQRLLLGQVEREPVKTVQHREGTALAGPRSRGRPRTGGVEHRAVEYGPGRRRGPGQRGRTRPRGGDERLEELADHAEGIVALQFAGPGPQHGHRGGRGPARFGQELGLADPGWAVDQDQVPLALSGGCDRLRQGGGLLFAFDDRGVGRRHGHEKDKGRGQGVLTRDLGGAVAKRWGSLLGLSAMCRRCPPARE